jgi:phage-related protein
MEGSSMPRKRKTEPQEPSWRIMYRIDIDAVVILEVYGKKTRKIPDEVIDRCKDRLKKYDAIVKSTKAK